MASTVGLMTAVGETSSRDAYRVRLLTGLAESIRQRGLQRTQISDIVRNARTSRRTFYECFADKAACFLQLIDASNLAVLAEMQAAIDPDAPWREQVAQAIDSYVDSLAGDAVLSATVSRELPTLGAEGAALQQVCMDRAAQVIVDLTGSEQLAREGVRPISREMALLLVGGITELIVDTNLRGGDLRAIAPVAKAAVVAVLDPSRGTN